MAAFQVCALLLISLAVCANAQSSSGASSYQQAYGSYSFYNANNIPLTILQFCATNAANCQASSYTNFCSAYETTCNYPFNSGSNANYVSILLSRYCSAWCGRCSSNYISSCIRNQSGGTSNLSGKKCEYSRQVSTSPRIYDGKPASQCENPWVVKMDVPNSKDLLKFCQGVLINKETVATTIECFQLLYSLPPSPPPQGKYTVTIGDFLNLVDETADEVKTATLHSINYRNDIVTMTLDVPLTEYSYCVAPVCLASSDRTIQVDKKKCKITGWGPTSGSTGVPSPALTKADVTVAEDAECASILAIAKLGALPGVFQPTADVNVTGCLSLATTNQASACPGDEGGAVTCEEKFTREQILVGLIKAGACDSLPATFFTKINNLL